MPRGGRAVEGDVTTGGRKYAIGCLWSEGPHWNTEEKKGGGNHLWIRMGIRPHVIAYWGLYNWCTNSVRLRVEAGISVSFLLVFGYIRRR